MPIETGHPAPDFTLYTDQREPYTLSKHRDRHAVLLFFPGAFTSTCTEEMCTVNDAMGEYDDLDAEVIGISADAPAVLAEFRNQNGLTFPLLSDHYGEASAAYGAQFSTDEHFLGYDRIAKRAAFVIDRDGVVRYAEVLANPGKLPDFDAIRRALEGLA
jgi:glutaredoxin-dependent peroxiredoxin